MEASSTMLLNDMCKVVGRLIAINVVQIGTALVCNRYIDGK